MAKDNDEGKPGKGLAILIAQRMREKDGKDDDEDKYKSMAEEIMSAIESKDVNDLADALKDFVTVCINEEE